MARRLNPDNAKANARAQKQVSLRSQDAMNAWTRAGGKPSDLKALAKIARRAKNQKTPVRKMK